MNFLGGTAENPYNIFMSANVSESSIEMISAYLNLIGQPARIRILTVISAQEACVCHLEAALGMRQASISQHLMILRKAGIVSTHRVGRNIFYQLTQFEWVNLVRQIAPLAGADLSDLERLSIRPIAGCCCPQCNPGLSPEQTCRKSKPSSTKRG